MLQSGYAPSLQPSSHRTPSQQSQVQTITPQPTPPFIQPRTQNGFPFAGPIGQHQAASALQQQQLTSQQLQSANGTSNSHLPHLAQTPSLGTAASVSSTSEVGLDPNDFPALGSASANNNISSGSNGGTLGGATTSYASQAGTGVPLGGTGGIGSGAGTIGGGSANQTRDFTPDDFPALGGQPQSRGQTPPESSSQDNHSHPPGLNGFHTEHSQQQHRQNLLGALSAAGLQQPTTPGMLNLGQAQTRNVHPGFQQNHTEAEKQQQQRVSLIPQLDAFLGFVVPLSATLVLGRVY